MEEKVKQLKELGRLIEARRVEIGFSKNAWCQRWGQLGSPKTYGRIIDPNDKLEELDIRRQTDNYLAAWELIQSFKDDPETTKVYTDFDWMQEAFTDICGALEDPGITRFVLVTGRSGAGKSSIIQMLEEHPQTASITFGIEATEAWRQSINQLLAELIMSQGMYDAITPAERKLGLTVPRGMPHTPGGRLRKLIERLDHHRVILAIDEGHHIGPEGLNLVKTIINQTRAVVVMTSVPEIISRISRESWVEASQLFHNRLHAHIRVPEPSKSDVIEFFKRRGVKFASAADENDVAGKVAEEAKVMGLWKFVVRCAKEAKLRNGALSKLHFAEIIGKIKRKITL